MHTHLGVLGVTGFLMQDLSANPLDYVEGGRYNDRRVEISSSLDGTNPDLAAFSRRGRQDDRHDRHQRHLASPGAQLDYYQAVIDKMGRADRRSVRAAVRHAAGGSRPERHVVFGRWHWQDGDAGRRFRTASTVSRC